MKSVNWKTLAVLSAAAILNLSAEEMQRWDLKSAKPSEGNKGGKVTLAAAEEKAPGDRPVLNLHFDFAGAVQKEHTFAGMRFEMPKVNELSSLIFFVKGDLGGNSLVFQVRDANGRWFNFWPNKMGTPVEGFQKYKINLKGAAISSWGGDPKVPMTFPLTVFQLLVQYQSGDAARSGDLAFTSVDAE